MDYIIIRILSRICINFMVGMSSALLTLVAIKYISGVVSVKDKAVRIYIIIAASASIVSINYIVNILERISFLQK